VTLSGSWFCLKLFSGKGFTAVAHYFVMDWASVWVDHVKRKRWDYVPWCSASNALTWPDSPGESRIILYSLGKSVTDHFPNISGVRSILMKLRTKIRMEHFFLIVP